MRVLLIGSGGREHALAWKIARSPLLEKLYASPGSDAMEGLAERVRINLIDQAIMGDFCLEKKIDLVVVGPEAPLVDGLADRLSEKGIKVFGPGQRAAQLEGSKSFTKALCARAGIPTANFAYFDSHNKAKAYIEKVGTPIVIKADGLAAGKGVFVAMTPDEAAKALDECFSGTFGTAGIRVVIEEYLEGEEASFFALCDGKTVLAFGNAQDHKRAYDNDEGPNTGGMGAYSPAPIITDQAAERIMNEIIQPTVAALQKENIDYKGVLYAGLMMTKRGPVLIEYNVRFGDPECQVLMMRLESDLLELLMATAQGRLDECAVTWRNKAATTVVMASRGYPGMYEKGAPIPALSEAHETPDSMVFHAGTRLFSQNGLWHATGGRVLNVTALGADVRAARKAAYREVERLKWPEGFFRSDIAWRALEDK